jgi:hypothetical protein
MTVLFVDNNKIILNASKHFELDSYSETSKKIWECIRYLLNVLSCGCLKFDSFLAISLKDKTTVYILSDQIKTGYKKLNVTLPSSDPISQANISLFIRSQNPTEEFPLPSQSSQPASLPSSFKLPELSRAVFRKGSGQGTPVSNMIEGNTIEPVQCYSSGFAACFHTTQSQEEIWDFIQQIRRSSDPNPIKKQYYAESYARFNNNLSALHKALPGEPHEKSAKIYWNDQAEKVLFPYLFDTQKVDITDLVFMISSGEQQLGAPFQAPNMDFTRQLQFVGISTSKSSQPLETSLMLRAEAFTAMYQTPST